MEPRTLQYVARACAGEQLTGSPDAVVRRVCTDSRAVRPGDLFFALNGVRQAFLEPNLEVTIVFGDQQPDVFQSTTFAGPVVVQNNIVFVTISHRGHYLASQAPLPIAAFRGPQR